MTRRHAHPCRTMGTGGVRRSLAFAKACRLFIFAALLALTNPASAVLPPGTSILCRPDGMVVNARPLKTGDLFRVVANQRGGYVPEDLESQRPSGQALALAKRMAGPHGLAFRWEDGGLARHFLFPADPSGFGWKTGEPALVTVQVKSASNLGGPANLSQWAATVEPAETVALAPLTQSVQKRVLAIQKDLELFNASALWKGRSRTVAPLVWSARTWSTSPSSWGLGSLECLGGSGETVLYRMRVAPADTEAGMKENSVAHGYFAYILDGARGRFEVVLTVAAFSVWNK